LHFTFKEYIGVVLGYFLLLEMIKGLSVGDCLQDVQDGTRTTAECGWGYALDSDNYSETLIPIHYVAIATVIILVVLIKGWISVLGATTTLEYLKNAQTLYNSKWNKIQSMICGVLIFVFLCMGFFTSEGGLPVDDPAFYWTTALIATKEFVGGMKKPLCPVPSDDITDLTWVDVMKSDIMSLIISKNLEVGEKKGTPMSSV
jgi:hypothetical protein